MVHSTQGSLREGDLIRLTKFVYLTQPASDIHPRGVVRCGIPRFEDGQDSLRREEVFPRDGLVVWRRAVVVVVIAWGVAVDNGIGQKLSGGN